MSSVDTLNVFIVSLGDVLAWPTFGYLLIGAGVGFLVGILPGLGGSTALALMLPFTFTMEPVAALSFLLAMTATTGTTGDITSILFGVPGEASSAAIVLDGYPMTLRGMAGRALGIALSSSMLGAVIGAAFMALIVPFIRPLVLGFGPAELFMLAVLGLTMVSVLSEGAALKGLIMACLGLLLAMVGQDLGTASLRFTFGEARLFDGIDLVPLTIGLFAVPSVIGLMALGSGDRPSAPAAVSGVLIGLRDTLRHWSLVIRSSMIGVFFGVLPGIGGGGSQFIAYAHARQISREPQKFGKGSIEGVVAAGAVNNAKDGGDLLPTVAFGIPGSGSMAILLGAFIITGINPGPEMLDEHLDVTFSLIWTIVLANIVTVAVCFGGLGRIARLSTVPGVQLAPFLLTFIAIGAYAAGSFWFSVAVMLAFGVFGWFAKLWDWPLPPLLLGFVLGGIAESNFFLSYSIYDDGYGWLGRPVVLVIIGLIVLSLGYSLWRAAKQRRKHEPAGGPAGDSHPIRLTLAVAMVVVAAGAIYQLEFARDYPTRAKLFPLTIAVVMLGVSLVDLLRSCMRLVRRSRVDHMPAAYVASADDDEAPQFAAAEELSSLSLRARVIACLQFAGFFMLLWLVGFALAVPIFTAAFLYLAARTRLVTAVAIAVVTTAFLHLLFVELVPIPLGKGVLLSVPL